MEGKKIPKKKEEKNKREERRGVGGGGDESIRGARIFERRLNVVLIHHLRET